MKPLLTGLRRLNNRLTNSYFSIRSILSFVGWIALLGFPGFFIIWSYYQQPYENAWLRVFGMALAAIILLRDRLPPVLHRTMPFYWFFFVTFTLPFFHTFMLLANHLNEMWSVATTIALLLLFVLFDPFLATLSLATGLGSALLVFWWWQGAVVIPEARPFFIPVLLYAVLVGAVIQRREQNIITERYRATLAVASKIAHEIRTPMMTIQALGMALENSREPASRTIADDLASASDDVLKTIEMVLMISRANDRIKSLFTAIDLADLVFDTLEHYPFSSSIERESVRVDRSDGTQNTVVCGDETLLRHITMNLLKNALYFAKQGGGHVAVRVSQQQDTVILSVSDDGPGVDPSRRLIIFDQYVTLAVDGIGTGLGLSFVKSACSVMGGDVTCTDNEQWPAVFTVALPAFAGVENV